jgi:hypothetical protein
MKRRILPLVFLLAIVLFAVVYVFFLKTKEQRILEIKIVTNATLCSSGNSDLCPEGVSLLRIYEGSDVVYYPTLRVKRLDITNTEADIMLSRNITTEMDKDDVLEIIRNAVNDQMPSLACKPTIEGHLDFSKDTLNVRHFFLVSQGDSRIDEKLYFDRIDKISTYLERLIEKGDFFSKNQKPDAVNVIILKGEASAARKEVLGTKAESRPQELEKEVSNENSSSGSGARETIDTSEADEVKPSVDQLSVDHDGGRNIISWVSNYDDAEYEVSISCDEDCYGDGTDYSYTTRVSNRNSVEVDLSSKWDGIKQRKFQVRVVMTRAGKTSSKTKSGVKLFCK